MTNLFVWGCITPFPAEIIFVALALLSWVVFLEGRWVFFIFKCSLVDIQLQNERKYLNTKSELRCEVWSHSILTDIHSGNSNTIPWTSRQPYHMPLSEQCHPICQNHHSENERTKIKQNVLYQLALSQVSPGHHGQVSMDETSDRVSDFMWPNSHNLFDDDIHPRLDL